MKLLNIHNSAAPKINIKENQIPQDGDFKDFLFGAIDKLNAFESEASRMGEKLAIGEIDNVHDVMIAAQKSEIALQFAIEVKNKVMDAYREIMRMQV